MLKDRRDAGLPEPEFESRAGAFRTVFTRVKSLDRQTRGLALSPRQMQAVRQATDRGRITLAAYERLVDMPKRTLQRDLKELVEKGVLVKRGTARTTWYEPKK